MDKISKIILDYPNLTRADLATYAAIEELGGDAYRTDIATRANISEWQVTQSFKHLQNCGLLRISRFYDKERQKTRNTYTPTLSNTNIGSTQHWLDPILGRPNPMELGRPNPLLTNTFTESNMSQEKQLTLIENGNAQNLGALDIQAQQQIADLRALGINPNVTQSGRNAPTLVKERTPAEILIGYDPDKAISQNLSRWRAAHDNGADVTNAAAWSEALIWTKIVELQPPPGDQSQENRTEKRPKKASKKTYSDFVGSEVEFLINQGHLVNSMRLRDILPERDWPKFANNPAAASENIYTEVTGDRSEVARLLSERYAAALVR